MKKIAIIVLLACVFLGSILGYVVSANKSTTIQEELVKDEEQNGLSTQKQTLPPLEKLEVEEPVELEIPALRIDAEIESVGLDSENRMDTPKNVHNTGWYMLGVKPGEVGSALIDGHYDTPTGAPSVFYALDKAKAGDVIYITDKNGKKHTFEVYDIQDYHYTKVPMGELISKTSEKRVHLITCGGKWDSDQETYTNRTVVSARIAE